MRYLIILILLSSCAPMPGPRALGLDGGDPIAFLDANMGEGKMSAEFEQCGPMPLKQTIAEDRLTIVFNTPEETSWSCFDNSNVSRWWGLLAHPVACAYAKIEDDKPCKPQWTVYVPTGNTGAFLHELRHVQGYDDKLY